MEFSFHTRNSGILKRMFVRLMAEIEIPPVEIEFQNPSPASSLSRAGLTRASRSLVRHSRLNHG